MRILILTDHFPPLGQGGAGATTLTEARALHHLGHEVNVLSIRYSADQPTDVEIDGIPVHRLHIAYPPRWRSYLSLYNLSAARQVKAYLTGHTFDIVHAHNVHGYLTYHSLTLVKQRGWPLVLTTHDVMSAAYQKFDSYIDPNWQHIPTEFDYRVRSLSQLRKQRFRYFPFRNTIIRRVIKRNVDVIVSPSAELIKFLKANRVTAPRMQIVHNGLDSARFTSTPDQQFIFRQSQGLQNRRLILFAGRVNGTKGGAQILVALPYIASNVPEVTLLVLARPGGYGEWMLAEAERMGVRHNIHFAGWLDGEMLSAAYGASDVCVIPSICFDNFPTVALEAGAARLPVIATCFGGAREIVTDDQTGHIINPYHIETLAKRITTLLTDDELRHRMGEAARRRVLAEFDWLQQAEKLVDIYRSLQEE